MTVRDCARKAPRPGLAGRGVGVRGFLQRRASSRRVIYRFQFAVRWQGLEVSSPKPRCLGWIDNDACKTNVQQIRSQRHSSLSDGAAGPWGNHGISLNRTRFHRIGSDGRSTRLFQIPGFQQRRFQPLPPHVRIWREPCSFPEVSGASKSCNGCYVSLCLCEKTRFWTNEGRHQ